MSITNHNGSITLTSLAELGSVLDPRTLPPGPSTTTETEHSPEASAVTPTLDLAGLIAQLASVSSGLETMIRQDARAREQATVELAQYETTLAERHDAERALGEARRIRAAAEQLATEAFTDDARAQAAQHTAVARAAELSCTQLLAELTRAAEELASRPHLARVVSERRRLVQEQVEAAERARVEQAGRLSNGLAALDVALDANDLDRAQQLLGALNLEFAEDQKVRSKVDALRWRLRQRLVMPAEAALREVLRRPFRDDPEAAAARLAELIVDNLPEDLARRVFGLWSNASGRVVQQRGWLEPRRYAPATSRGMVFARPTPDAAYEVVSVLGLTDWKPGDIVKSQRIVNASRELELR